MKEKDYVIYSSMVIKAKSKQEAKRRLKREFKKFRKGEPSVLNQFLGEIDIELEENYF